MCEGIEYGESLDSPISGLLHDRVAEIARQLKVNEPAVYCYIKLRAKS